MMKVGICDDTIKCLICKRHLKSTSKVVTWAATSGREVKKRTSGFICVKCNYFYVTKGMETDDSTWETLYLVTSSIESTNKRKITEKSNLTIKQQKRIYKARFPEHKSCGNCNFYTKHGRCVTHSLQVESNELCNRYQNYIPKIYHGGSFSPR